MSETETPAYTKVEYLVEFVGRSGWLPYPGKVHDNAAGAVAYAASVEPGTRGVRVLRVETVAYVVA